MPPCGTRQGNSVNKAKTLSAQAVQAAASTVRQASTATQGKIASRVQLASSATVVRPVAPSAWQASTAEAAGAHAKIARQASTRMLIAGHAAIACQASTPMLIARHARYAQMESLGPAGGKEIALTSLNIITQKTIARGTTKTRILAIHPVIHAIILAIGVMTIAAPLCLQGITGVTADAMITAIIIAMAIAMSSATISMLRRSRWKTPERLLSLLLMRGKIARHVAETEYMVGPSGS